MKTILNLQKLILFSSLVLSILISCSSNSMLGIWMGMEINLFTIIPIMSIDQKKNVEKSIMMYFLVQGISSSMMLFSILTMYIEQNFLNLFIYMFFLSMIMKMGMFPFHFWMLTVLENLPWMMCFILLTIQKIIPLISMMMVTQEKSIIILSLINSTFASITGLKTFSLRKIMGISSMNHLSLMLISIMLSKKLFKVYFLIYMISSFISMKIFDLNNINYIHQIMKMFKFNKLENMSILLSFFSLAGLPPFLGFMPKMIMIMKMTEMYIIVPTILILLTNSLATFFYLRLSISTMIMNNNSYKTVFQKKSSVWYSFILLLTPIIFLL
uniref:NADH dehydrogenase subunit 2 n=1 Tax=Mycterothrips gongshanensis TaxID=2792509 RepID=UPI0022059EB2|nr:NADH dehydrogenase subunit 2 [Mycterothrips gongshanensis]UXW64210.1 NADH dehydrogenase subunit 2 [Mycterothrips gongshanensis]